MTCRHCGAPLALPFVDLGTAPPSNAYLRPEDLSAPETWLPLRVLVCERCWLVQTADVTDAPAMFNESYAYFSGFSTTWLDHARRYVEQVTARFGLGRSSHVVEVAANDGSLLQYVKGLGIPCLGIEPTASTAAAARDKGIPVVQEFFGVDLARRLSTEGARADLMAANNVLAHVPDINDFVAGFAILLKDDGVATFEFPHLMKMVEQAQFDTIYHEHFSYLSLTAVERVLAGNGLSVFDVEELPTHGGSLRVFAQRTETGRHPREARVDALRRREAEAGVERADYYRGFGLRAEQVKNDLLSFLLEARRAGRTVAGYGAAAKGNTLLNFAGVRRDLLPFVVDRNPAKQGLFMPGSRIPVVAEEELSRARPDYIVLLPWNLRQEISEQLSYTRDWGARLVTAIPRLEVA